MTPPKKHICSHEKMIIGLKTKVNLLLGMVSIFIIIVSLTLTQAYGAKEATLTSAKKIEAVNSRVDVQEERLKWIVEGIKRIEKKLEKE